MTPDQDDPLLRSVGKLVFSLHVERSMGVLHPVTRAAYDEVRSLIDDSGWSSADDIARRLAKYLATSGASSDAVPPALSAARPAAVPADVPPGLTEADVLALDPPPDRRVKDDPHVPPWEERRGR